MASHRSPQTSAAASPQRHIPSVNAVVDSPVLAAWNDRVPRSVVVEAARETLAGYRERLDQGGETPSLPSLDDFARRVVARLEVNEMPRLQPVINATGILLHTGLGRAPLGEPALKALEQVGGSYASIELDLPSGERGRRATTVRDLLGKITGAESATVVNNNAAAILIMLNTLARGRSVVVSRGELIEIGGSFRLPEIMRASGAVLREVGTTNKTRLRDYELAIDEDTAALLKVHTSNFRVVGFTKSVEIDEMVKLGQKHGLPVVFDIGSGVLEDVQQHGLPYEPSANEAIRAGTDLVLFSGDKLLGGPQAGIIVGRQRWIEQIEMNPLMRAMRVDKLVLAALEATLRLHRDPQQARRHIPVLEMATIPVPVLQERAEKLVEQFCALEHVREADVGRETAYVGGGSLPTQGIASVVVRVRVRDISEDELSRRLRLGNPSVVARVHHGRIQLDLRTIFPRQDAALVAAVRAALSP